MVRPAEGRDPWTAWRRHAALDHDDPSASDRSRIPVAQASRSVPELRPELRPRARLLPRGCARALCGVPLLDVDPVGTVRGKGSAEGLLDQYVNDRPYACTSFLSVAIAQVLGSALSG